MSQFGLTVDFDPASKMVHRSERRSNVLVSEVAAIPIGGPNKYVFNNTDPTSLTIDCNRAMT